MASRRANSDTLTTGRPWLAVRTPWLARYAPLPSSTLGAWLRLAGACATRLTGGRLAGAGRWTDREWLLATHLDRAEVDAVVTAGLASWRSEDLAVHDYDGDFEKTYREQRDRAVALTTQRPTTSPPDIVHDVGGYVDGDADRDIEGEKDTDAPSGGSAPEARTPQVGAGRSTGPDLVAAVWAAWVESHVQAQRAAPARWGKRERGQAGHLLDKLGHHPDPVAEARRRIDIALTKSSKFWKDRGGLSIGDILTNINEFARPATGAAAGHATSPPASRFGLSDPVAALKGGGR